MEDLSPILLKPSEVSFEKPLRNFSLPGRKIIGNCIIKFPMGFVSRCIALEKALVFGSKVYTGIVPLAEIETNVWQCSIHNIYECTGGYVYE